MVSDDDAILINISSKRAVHVASLKMQKRKQSKVQIT